MSDLAKVFGQKVRALRLDRGLTQAQLADLAGLSDVWVRQIEGGKAPSFDVIGALARALQADASDLFHLHMPAKPAERFADAVGDLDQDEVDWLIKGARLLRAHKSR